MKPLREWLEERFGRLYLVMVNLEHAVKIVVGDAVYVDMVDKSGIVLDPSRTHIVEIDGKTWLVMV